MGILANEHYQISGGTREYWTARRCFKIQDYFIIFDDVYLSFWDEN